jgi:shikimate dehydrogenase
MTRTLVGLIGANIQQSLSPALHEDAFAAIGVVGHYHLMDVDVLPGRRLEDLLAAARTAGFAGLNVTFPFKEAVIPLLDAVSDEARQIGAVNTVVIDPAGRTTGHNTDRSGFRAAFAETFGKDTVRDQAVLQLGAGGAGRAVAFALRDLGVGSLAIYDVDGERARRLCADIGDCAKPIDAPEPVAGAVAGIVNATPVGMQGHEGLPITPDSIQSGQFVADVIYTPLETQFLKAAKARGARTMGGAGMCVHQAVDAFRHFTGKTPDIARMKLTFTAAAGRRVDAGRS